MAGSPHAPQPHAPEPPAAGARPRGVIVAALAVVASLSLVVAVSGRHDAAADGHVHPVAVEASATGRQAAFHDAMRRLWEDHATWTRLTIISFAHDLPDLAATRDRLFRNQKDIGDAIAPYYGRAAGKRLTGLLNAHIGGAVVLLQAVRSGNPADITRRTAEWYANGNQIADFLAGANPRNWPRPVMRRMMRQHLDQTLEEAGDRLGGKYAADVRDYDVVHRHILEMADGLSAGIIAQFPARFR